MKRGFLQTSEVERCQFVGCLHLLPLPGSHLWSGDFQAVEELCFKEADIYLEEGVHALILENTHDTPYNRGFAEPATVAAMAKIAGKLRERYPDTPIGIQILAAADMAALEVAITCDLDFIRAEGFAYAHVADEGFVQGEAYKLLRRRTHLLGQHIEIFTDIKKKHSSHAITGDLSLREYAEGALFCGADGLIVTGSSTGKAVAEEDLLALEGISSRILVGSGVSLENIGRLSTLSDALIVGSWCKEGHHWRNVVSRENVRLLLREMSGTS